MQKIFGLFLNNTVLAVMEENVFLSKPKEELEHTCLDLLPFQEENRIHAWINPASVFNIDSMECEIIGNNGICTIEFKELNVIK